MEQIMAKSHLGGLPTLEQLQSRLTYDPKTGAFRWKPREPGTQYNSWSGKWAGSVRTPDGFVVIRFNDQLYRANRLAWLWMTGEWPTGEVKHRDGDPKNNKWSNLRAATSSQDKPNKRLRRDNTSNVKGIWRDERRDSWCVEIWAGGKKHYIGSYKTDIAARAAYMDAVRRLHGKFTRFS